MKRNLPDQKLMATNDEIEVILKKLKKHKTQSYGIYYPEVFRDENETPLRIGAGSISYNFSEKEGHPTYEEVIDLNFRIPIHAENENGEYIESYINKSTSKTVFQALNPYSLIYVTDVDTSYTEYSDQETPMLNETNFSEIYLNKKNQYECLTIKNGKKKNKIIKSPFISLHHRMVEDAYILRNKHKIGDEFTSFAPTPVDFTCMNLKLIEKFKEKNKNIFTFNITKFESKNTKGDKEHNDLINKHPETNQIILTEDLLVDTMSLGPIVMFNEKKSELAEIESMIRF